MSMLTERVLRSELACLRTHEESNRKLRAENERLRDKNSEWEGLVTYGQIQHPKELADLRAENERLLARIRAAERSVPPFDAREFMDSFEKTTTEEILQAAYELGGERAALAEEKS